MNHKELEIHKNEIDKDIMSTENGVNPPAPNPAHNSNFSLLSVLGRERLTVLTIWTRYETLDERKETSIMKLHSLLQTAEQGIKKIYVPSTSAAPVLTVGHNEVELPTGNIKGHWNVAAKISEGPQNERSKRGSALQGILKESRRLKHGELNLVMGNRKITPVTRIRKYELMLKSVVRIDLNNDKISDSTLNELDKPANYKEAMASPEAAKLKEAIKSEIQSMYDNQVWNLVDTTPSLKTVGCKWIFKKKTYMDGKVHTYKARLVVKGYTQTHGIDYEETFST
ncbi:retrotransposon protein, putative, ty1-copia subclass [Tanacetum coccineum]